ncbi:MAG TPA: neutral zinc metallopeptidase [Bacteroidia bacterium]|nr:neutral zinc metallopeptidase [Bacteroidia bacterium]HNS11787.1 neutral zinc metallopeptidase [Bacteroidia bacterium]
MRWRGNRESSNVEDRRGSGGRNTVIGGGLGIIIVIILSLVMGEDPTKVLQNVMPDGQQGMEQYAPANTAEDEEAASFVKVVLAENEDVWNSLFAQNGKSYTEPVLVLFRNQVSSACGSASSSSGPFYCSADQKIYIDLSFYDELKTRFNAPGDFAMAYVIAHEVGHHVQNLLGISAQVHAQRGRLSEEEYNQLSVRLELQADFFAGLWAHHADRMKSILEEGDIEEALNAANAIGDDRLQKQSQGYIVPDAFTHGTSAQRMRWFKKGYTSGDIGQGDTFAASSL